MHGVSSQSLEYIQSSSASVQPTSSLLTLSTKKKIAHKLLLDDELACGDDDPKNISNGNPLVLFFFSFLLGVDDSDGIGGMEGKGICGGGVGFLRIPLGSGFLSIGGGRGRGFCCQKRRGEIAGIISGAA